MVRYSSPGISSLNKLFLEKSPIAYFRVRQALSDFISFISQTLSHVQTRVICMLLSCQQSNFLITVSWDGQAGTSLWSEEKNWSTEVVPQPGEDVKIDGGVSVLMNVSATVQSLSVEQAELDVGSGQSLIITGMSGPAQAIFLKNAALNILGIVNISNYEGHGVFVDVGGVRKNIGRLLISDTEHGKGIISYGYVAMLGHLTIRNIDSCAIYNAGEFTIEDSVIIIGTKKDRAYGIHNVLDFNIAASGVVCVDSILGGFNSNAIHNESSFINKGLVLTDTVSGIGFYNDGQLTNQGNIQIASAENSGMWNDSTVQNQLGSSMAITKIMSSASALRNRGFYLNQGLTKVFACRAIGIKNEGHIDNMDSLVLIETSGFAIENQDSLCNYGQLMIDSVANFGYGIQNTGKILNDGKMRIPSLAQQAIYILSNEFLLNQDSVIITTCSHAINNVSYSIINESGGFIQIKDVDTAITGETPSTYINQGQIHIENVSSGITVSGHFFNGVGADILGTGINGTMLSASVGGFYQAEFTNLGTLSLSP